MIISRVIIKNISGGIMPTERDLPPTMNFTNPLKPLYRNKFQRIYKLAIEAREIEGRKAVVGKLGKTDMREQR